MRTNSLSLALASVAVIASMGGAQTGSPLRVAAPRFIAMGDLVLSQPKGEFASYVDRGFGFNGGALLRIDPVGMFGVRADVGGLRYGRERMPVAFSPFSGRVTAEVVTNNTIGWVGIGPQFTFPAGPIRPYANASFALTNFRTTSALQDRETSEQFAVTENASDWSSAVVFGGGVYIPFGGPTSLAMLTIGGKYYYGGEATYLPEGGIEDNPDGSITLRPARSKTDFVIWQLGVSVGIPPRRP